MMLHTWPSKSDLLPIKKMTWGQKNTSSRQPSHALKGKLTVLGLVRFLASVSQLLRWLYVLRLVMSYTIRAPAAPL